MSNYDQWLECQGGVYDQLPSCQDCGYELCEHAVCRHCVGCANCDAEEETERVARKPAARVPPLSEHRRAG